MPLTIKTNSSFLELERELIDYIDIIKKQNLFQKILIVVPSTHLKNYLLYKLANCQINKRAIINLRILTIPALIDEISLPFFDKEYTTIKESTFYEILVKEILATSEKDNSALAKRLNQTPRGNFYLYLTFKDLENSGLTSEYANLIIDEINRHSEFGQLMQMYLDYLQKLDELKIRRFCDLISVAIQNTNRSTLIREYNNLHFYGFYDFTGLQKDLINAISSMIDVYLYLPHEKNNERYKFTSNLLDSLITDRADTTVVDGSQLHENRVKEPNITFLSAINHEKEIVLVAKEILRLANDNSLDIFKPFKIALLARDIDNSLYTIEKIFNENRIPWFSTREKESSYSQIPILIRTIISFITNDYSKKDFELLLRLTSVTLDPIWYTWRTTQPTFKEFGEWFLNVIDKSVQELYDELCDNDKKILDEIKNFLTNLSLFDRIKIKPDLDLFFSLILSKLKSITVKVGGEGYGVFVSDVMSARGINFKYVFIVGLNDGIFPRIIREDPFLLDENRRYLRKMIKDSLGFKIPLKEDGYYEERLLFTLSLLSANKKLYLSSQREDQHGKLLNQSIFVKQLRSLLNEHKFAFDEITLPKHLSEQNDLLIKLSNISILSPNELITHLAINKNSAGIFNNEVINNIISLTNYNHSLINHGIQKAYLFSNCESNNLSSYDGFVGPVDDYKERLWVTHLNTLNKCPYLYFLEKVALLKSHKINDLWKLDKRDEGKLVHDTLAKLYSENIVNRKLSELDRSKLFIKLEQIFNSLFNEFIEENPCNVSIYAEYTKKRITNYLTKRVEYDIDSRFKNGIQCIYVEGCDWPLNLPQSYLDVNGDKIKFRVDRIDLLSDGKSLEYLDYKIGKKQKRSELLKVSPGSNLQIPVYILSAFNSDINSSKINALYSYLKESGESEDKISFDEIAHESENIINFISIIINLLKDGKFIFHETARNSCGYCDYKYVCRRSSNVAIKRMRNLVDKDVRNFTNFNKEKVTDE